MTKKPLIKRFSHTDLDGVGSALLLPAVLSKFPEFAEAEYLGVTYCEPGNEGTIDPNVLAFIAENEEPITHLFITDICPSEEVVEKLAAYCKEKAIEWRIFDHHISSIAINAAFPDNSRVIVQDETTGLKHAGTTVLFKEIVGKMPTELFDDQQWGQLANVADCIRCYDCWDWQANPAAAYKEEAKDFNNLFYFFSFDKRVQLMEAVMANGLTYLEQYQDIITAMQEKEADYIKGKLKHARFGTLAGLHFAYTFGEQYQSSLGNAMAQLVNPATDEVADFSLVIVGEGVSLRAVKDDVDLSRIAKRYFNGGGHQKASGGSFFKQELFVFDQDTDTTMRLLEIASR